jgi:hypothetical protein
MAKNNKPNAGLATDSGGNPVVDPTENVKALTEAANLRQDDLRKASDRYNQSEISHVKELAALRASYQEKLTIAEAKRIDAIRSVDVNAVAIASEKQAMAASVLGEQFKQYADQINTRLSAIEKSQYEGKGKGEGNKASTVLIMAVIAMLITLIFGVLNYFKG